MSRRDCIPWLALGFLALVLVLFAGAWAVLQWHIALPPCPVKAHLQVPCATCGLTRCILALAQGHWAEAFHWHPMAVLLGLASPLAVGWDVRRAWRGEACPPLPDSLAARLSVAGLLAGTWLLQIARGI